MATTGRMVRVSFTVDEGLWRQFKIEALKRDMSAGALLNEIIEAWLHKRKKEGE